MKKVLTIAGSDCSGGAGIQADLKTIMAHGMYGMSAITAVTVQNTTGVQQVCKLPPEVVEGQITAILQDIVPDAIKIGMLTDTATVNAVVAAIKGKIFCPLVIDTVMISTSGKRLLDEEALSLYCQELLPLATVITPNLPELGALCEFYGCVGEALLSKEGMKEQEIIRQGKDLQQKLSTAILVKGGHRDSSARDILFVEDRQISYSGEKLSNPNTHGTGCTLSAAIACELAAGQSIEVAVEWAKAYITACIADGMNLGKGNGPLNHLAGMK